LEGIKARIGADTKLVYAKGCGITDTSTAGFAEAVALARLGNVAVLVLGEAGDMSGEAASRSTLGLPGVQQQLLEAIHATGTPVVLVLMNGRPLAVPWAADHVPAIVESWFLGVETGHALAAVLFGDVGPSGKLPVRVPRAGACGRAALLAPARGGDHGRVLADAEAARLLRPGHEVRRGAGDVPRVRGRELGRWAGGAVRGAGAGAGAAVGGKAASGQPR